MAIVFFISLAIGIGYQAMVLYLFGVPKSISESFYLLDEKRRGLGWLFWGWAVATVFSICPMMFALSDGHWYQFLALFVGAGLLLAGSAPHFREEYQRSAHFSGTGVSMFAAVLWMSCSGYLYMPVMMVLLTFLIVSPAISVMSGSVMYWLEISLIASMYLTIWILLNY